MRVFVTKQNVRPLFTIIFTGILAFFFLLLFFRGIGQHDRLHAWITAVMAPAGYVPPEDVESTDIAWQTWMHERRPCCPICGQAIQFVYTNSVGEQILFYGPNRTVRPGHFYAFCPTSDDQGRRLFQFGNTTYLLPDDYIDWKYARLAKGKLCDIERASMYRLFLWAHIPPCGPYVWVGERISGHTVTKEERSN